MRRKSQGVFAPALARSLDAIFDRVPAADVIAVLRRHVTPARLERIESIARTRLASVTVLMDAPHDPHNGAAVVRTLDAFGVQDLHVVERDKPFLISATVTRGAHKWVDVHTYPRAAGAVRALRDARFTLVATHPGGELVPADLAPIANLCLVLGNERDGISDELRASCDRAVRVPMRGFSESLNVSVTAAILVGRAAEARPGDLPDVRRERYVARGLMHSVEHAPAVLVHAGLIPHENVLPPR